MHGQPAQQPAEQLAVLIAVQAAEQLVLGSAQPLVQLGQRAVALLGGHDPPGPPVGRVRAALDEPGGLQVVEQVGHDRAVHAQVLGQGQLAVARFAQMLGVPVGEATGNAAGKAANPAGGSPPEE